MAARDRKKPGEDLGANLERAKAQVMDRRAKAAADTRKRRRLARATGVIPRKPKPPSNLDLVTSAFKKKTYNQ